MLVMLQGCRRGRVTALRMRYMRDEVWPFFLTVNSESLGRDLDLAPLYPQYAGALADWVFNPFAEPK